ncbi:hypothetical protein N7539_006260 [Penicillium diatomitis]|uniref:Uncharacterized protein n=1 Tax=Penicillium diatomitis TaxID=2819901 RepID=A0A9X0BT62_9EURO|nr:uncharacterized protein N7539_006260 [Penicillium diatomitis]KAJ5482814.1 hypothetical protein N7539_006260 [Penicillium diatomitis]
MEFDQSGWRMGFSVSDSQIHLTRLDLFHMFSEEQLRGPRFGPPDFFRGQRPEGDQVKHATDPASKW